jgi:hypothetical protein
MSRQILSEFCYFFYLFCGRGVEAGALLAFTLLALGWALDI